MESCIIYHYINNLDDHKKYLNENYNYKENSKFLLSREEEKNFRKNLQYLHSSIDHLIILSLKLISEDASRSWTYFLFLLKGAQHRLISMSSGPLFSPETFA